MAGLQLIWAMVSRLVVSRAVCAHAGGGQRRLGARMPAADHQHVEVVDSAHGVIINGSVAGAKRIPWRRRIACEREER